MLVRASTGTLRGHDWAACPGESGIAIESDNQVTITDDALEFFAFVKSSKASSIVMDNKPVHLTSGPVYLCHDYALNSETIDSIKRELVK